MKYRLTKLQSILRQKRIRAFWVVQPENIFYLTNYSQDLKLLITPNQGYIITDPRSAGLLRQRVKAFKVVEITIDSSEVLTRLIKRTKARTLYTEDGITVAGLKSLTKKFKRVNPAAGRYSGVKAIKSPITNLRLIKEPQEIKKIKKAIQITKSCCQFLKRKIRAGMTEKQIVWLIEKYIREHGGDGLAFPPIVAVGPNAAVPHHQPGETKVRRGTMLLLDFGAQYQGYHGDLTRTWFFGRPTKRFLYLYQEIKKAKKQAIKFIQSQLKARKPITEKQVDQTVRGYLKKQGLGQYFTHGSGHGIGLEIHEAPNFHQRRATGLKLQNGMVFTIEPGIYIKGWGGIRQEDDYIIQGDRLVRL